MCSVLKGNEFTTSSSLIFLMFTIVSKVLYYVMHVMRTYVCVTTSIVQCKSVGSGNSQVVQL